VSFTLFDNKVADGDGDGNEAQEQDSSRIPSFGSPCQSKNICLQFAWLHARSEVPRLHRSIYRLQESPTPRISTADWIGLDRGSFSPLLTFGRGRFDVDYAKPIMKWLWGFDWQNIAGYKCAHTTPPVCGSVCGCVFERLCVFALKFTLY